MAGFLKRVRRLTLGKIVAFLEGADDPQSVFSHLIQELRQECRRGIDAEATAFAALRRREMECEEAKAEVDKWALRAELAAQDRDYGLARTALERQMPAEDALAARQAALEAARAAAHNAREARESLHAKLKALERKRDEILARARAARNQQEVQKALAGIRTDSGASLLDAVGRLELDVTSTEARADAYNHVASDILAADPEARFRELERKQAIEDRLAELKRKVAKSTPDATDKPDQAD